MLIDSERVRLCCLSDSGTDAMADLNFRAAGIAARAMMKVWEFSLSSNLLVLTNPSLRTRLCWCCLRAPSFVNALMISIRLALQYAIRSGLFGDSALTDVSPLSLCCQSVTLTLCPVSPFLTLTSTTPAGLCKVDFPIASDPTNSAIFQEFECKEKISNEYETAPSEVPSVCAFCGQLNLFCRRACRYPMQLIRMCAKAMQRSQTTSMRFNQNVRVSELFDAREFVSSPVCSCRSVQGVLSLQAVIPSADPKQANWVEFVVAPLDQSTAADGARDELERIKRESQQNQKQAEFM